MSRSGTGKCYNALKFVLECSYAARVCHTINQPRCRQKCLNFALISVFSFTDSRLITSLFSQTSSIAKISLLLERSQSVASIYPDVCLELTCEWNFCINYVRCDCSILANDDRVMWRITASAHAWSLSGGDMHLPTKYTKHGWTDQLDYEGEIAIDITESRGTNELSCRNEMEKDETIQRPRRGAQHRNPKRLKSRNIQQKRRCWRQGVVSNVITY